MGVDGGFRSVFVGGIKLVVPLVEALVDRDPGLRAIFCPSASCAAANSDYVPLKPYARGLAYREYDDLNAPQTVAQIAGFEPDVIYAIGTSQILSPELLAVAKQGCLGGHIALLPANRGRHPIIWAIANGLDQSGLSIIWMDQGADTGQIAIQQPFRIEPEENAGDVYAKVQALYVDLVADRLLPSFLKGEFPRASQPAETSSGMPSNTWRKRRQKDGVVDWRMSARRIHNLVRALYHPYPGAAFTHKGVLYSLWRTELADGPENLEPGKILAIEGRRILVKAGEGALWLTEHEFDPALTRVGRYFL